MRTLPLSFRFGLIFLLFLSLSAMDAKAGGDRPGGKSLGIRLGWSGGPNGLTYRNVFAYSQAFELVAGYNGKEARTSEEPWYKKGNTFLGITYAPFLYLSNGGGTAFVIHANLGTRVRYHNYRSWGSGTGNPVITPDLFAGGGVQLEFGDAVELFADLNMKYYNQSRNGYIMGLESGLGLRFALN